MWTTIDYGPEHLRFDTKARGVNQYDDKYRDAFNRFQQGTAQQQEEIVGKQMLGAQARAAARQARSSGPLGASLALAPSVQQGAAAAAQLGEARGRRTIGERQAITRALAQAGELDLARAEQESRRMALRDQFRDKARRARVAGDQVETAMYLQLLAGGLGKGKQAYDRKRV